MKVISPILIAMITSHLFLMKPVIAHEQGLYAFGWGANFQQTPAFSKNELSGMTAYFSWSDLEPEKGKYNFSAIEHLASKAKAANTKLNIGIYPGAFSPSWIFKEDVERFEWYWKYKEDRWRFSGLDGEWKRSPLPWDVTYLKYWKNFVSKLAQTYQFRDEIGYISLTGPTIETLSTGTILESDDDWERFKDSGYTIEKLKYAWIGVIEHYQQSFNGNKTLVIALGPEKPGSHNTELANQLTHYVINRGYKEIAFMSVFLNDTWFTRGGGALGIRRILKDAKRAGFMFGYQIGAPARTASKWQRDFRVINSLKGTCKIGINDGASWVEMWHQDLYTKQTNGAFIDYEGNKSDIEYCARTLREGY